MKSAYAQQKPSWVRKRQTTKMVFDVLAYFRIFFGPFSKVIWANYRRKGKWVNWYDKGGLEMARRRQVVLTSS